MPDPDPKHRAVEHTVTGDKNIIAGTGDVNISGDVIHGNKITNQLDEKVFKRLGLDHRKGMIVLGVILAVVVVASAFGLYQLLREKVPATMTGDFRIAVASMAVEGGVGQDDQGSEFARGIFGRLQTELSELPGITLWGPDWAGRVDGATPEDRATQAAQIAEKIDASVVVYGVVDTLNQVWRVTPEFYIKETDFSEAEEIGGPHGMTPVVLEGAGAMDRTRVSRQFTERTLVLSQVFEGLFAYLERDYKKALSIFESVEASPGREAGGKVLYLLMGNTAGKLSLQEAATDSLAAPWHLEKARTSYNEALALDAEYARAYVGLGSVSYLQALDRYRSTGLPADADTALLTQAIRFYQRAGQAGNQPPLAHIPAKVQFGLGSSYLMRFRAGGEDAYREQAIDAFEAVVAAYEDGDKRVRELAGEAHGRLALIADLSGERDEAITAYERAAALLNTVPVRQALFQQRADSLKQPSPSSSPVLLTLEAEVEDSVSSPSPPLTPGMEITVRPIPTFAAAGVQQTVPDDVLREISLFFLMALPPIRSPDLRVLRETQACTQPTILDESSRRAVIDESVEMLSCGWSLDDSVDVTLTRPDSSVIRYRVAVSPYPEVFFLQVRHDLQLFDPPGTYSFEFEGESGAVQHTVAIEDVSGPILYVADDATVQLFGFQPQERVRLFAYKGSSSMLELAGWQEYGVDAGGRLTIQVVAMQDVALWVVVREDDEEVLPYQSKRSGSTRSASILKRNQ